MHATVVGGAEFNLFYIFDPELFKDLYQTKVDSFEKFTDFVFLNKIFMINGLLFSNGE